MSSSPTSRPLPTEGPSAGGDEFDDLFDYEVGGEDDPFSENYKVPETAPAAKETNSKGKSGAGLGIDEEVEVTRKPRAPRVKLDEHRYVFRINHLDFADEN
jgi:replication fork protection complex subunit Csm3/Swi3